MPSETIIWTALPHGVTGQGGDRRFRISVLVSPRLEGDTDDGLSAFVEFAHWTQRVATSDKKFEVRWKTSGGSVSAGLITVQPQTLNPSMWDRLVFDTSQPVVRPRSVRVASTEQYASYAAASGFAAVRKSYESAAISAITGEPVNRAVDEVAESLRTLQDANATDRELEWTAPSGQRYLVRGAQAALRVATDRTNERRRLFDLDPASQAGGEPVRIEAFEPVGHADRGESEVAVAEMLAFFHQSLEASHAAGGTAGTEPDPPEFHELMTAIGNYPDLARRLGLIFELEVPAGPIGADGYGFIQVNPQWNPALSAAVSPWSAMHAKTGRSYSSPQQPSRIENGFLLSSAAGAGRLDLVPIDLASVALKLGNMTQQPGANRALLPALRTAGFSLVRADHGAIVHRGRGRAARNDARLRNAGKGTDAEIELFAEDLTRGYRLDVQPTDGDGWQSLHQLDRTFSSGTETWTVQEEGFHQLSGVESIAPGGSPYLLLEETMSSWTGWSASAHRPGASLKPDGTPERPPDALDLGGISVEQLVTPKSLPRLRYGRQYQFRVRAVDLAGNARALSDESTNALAMLPAPDAPAAFLRYEPLEPPVLVQLAPLGDGEAVDRLVVRSSMSQSARAFARANRATALANQRHVVPAKSTQLVAELHSMFDGAFGDSAGSAQARERAYTLAMREGASLSGDDALRAGDPAAAPIYPEPSLAVPYLPDPMGRGASLRNLPGPRSGKWGSIRADGVLEFQSDSAVGNGNLARIPYGKDADWPDLRPFRIQLDSSTDFKLPKWNAAQRLLTVALPPGEVVTVGLRSVVDFSDLDRLGIWQWAEQGLAELGEDLDPTVRRRRAMGGDFWFLTPERPLQLVHAVQQPIEEPTIFSISAEGRSAGATYAELENKLIIHSRTTARIDLEAVWTDTIDPVAAAPYTVKKSAVVRSQQINTFDGYDDWTRKGYRETVWQQKDTQMLTVYGALENPGFDPPKPVDPDGAPLPLPSILRDPMRHEFGDTKHRMATYTLVAGTRFREYFPESVTNDRANITRTSPSVEIPIPSSVRPPAPWVPYALPAFRWKTAAFAQPRERWGGIRVYLERPWYASGPGEKLAVVLWAGSNWPPEPGLDTVVTRWGFDPIWNGAADALDRRPMPQHFPLRDPQFDALRFSLPDVLGGANKTFAVAAHDVTFPPEDDVAAAGRCWCDIQIDPGDRYMPFVRLAVARFQPHSIAHCELSAIALTDFVQVAAHRTVSLSRSGSTTLAVTVSGETTGNAFQPDGRLFPANRIEVALERRIPGVPDEFGWEAASATIQAGAVSREILWQGTVTLPSSGEHRLVIREYEQLPSDDAPAGGLGSRLVFADTIPLP